MAASIFANYKPIVYNGKDMRDITQRAIFIERIRDDDRRCSDYRLRDGETPHSIAHDFYGDSELHWTIILLNKVVNPFHDWHMESNIFEQYLVDKYPTDLYPHGADTIAEYRLKPNVTFERGSNIDASGNVTVPPIGVAGTVDNEFGFMFGKPAFAGGNVSREFDDNGNLISTVVNVYGRNMQIGETDLNGVSGMRRVGLHQNNANRESLMTFLTENDAKVNLGIGYREFVDLIPFRAVEENLNERKRTVRIIRPEMMYKVRDQFVAAMKIV